jgi:hypothetical protein
MKPFLHAITDLVRLSTGELLGCCKDRRGYTRYFRIDEEFREVYESSYDRFQEHAPKKKELRKVRDSKAKRAYIRELNEKIIYMNVDYLGATFEWMIEYISHHLTFTGYSLNHEAIRSSSPELQALASVYEYMIEAEAALLVAGDIDSALGRFAMKKRPS